MGVLLMLVSAVLGTVGFAVLLRRFVQGTWYTRRCVDLDRDLRGRTAVITGGTSGIGLDVAMQLARMGCDLVVCCRGVDTPRTAAILAQLDAAGRGAVTSVELQLQDFTSVRRCATEVAQLEKTKRVSGIQYVVLNAGVMLASSAASDVTPDGLETTVQTNYMSHFLLLQLLKRRGVMPERVVSTSSGLHMKGDVARFILRAEPATPAQAYAASKRAQVMHMLQEAQRGGGNTLYASCTPGFCYTPLFQGWATRHAWLYLVFQHVVCAAVARTSEEGAQCLLHALLSPHVVSGGYYSNCLVKVPGTSQSPLRESDPEAEELWAYSMRTVAPHML